RDLRPSSALGTRQCCDFDRRQRTANRPKRTHSDPTPGCTQFKSDYCDQLRGIAMPQYLSPGVYVEEIDAGPQPIQGVSTSITGAVGVTVQGPTSGKPVLVTSFTDFQNNFGGFLPVPPSAI